ncbi:unnamed protein product [Rotaria sordida]|uniref:IRG-type G domain-containing protein n=2 Tax=Rotaria sordida TaxID=392033 RepID=A0A819Y321_9BILA|nr:unnamed protein product [Rotaria sordida]
MTVWYTFGNLIGFGADFEIKTASGRLLTAGLYLLCLVLVASYTANLASDLTISKSKNIISGIDDIKSGKILFNRIGILVGTASEEFYLREISSGSRNFYPLKSRQEIYDSLINNLIDVAFNDADVAEYMTNNIYCNATLIGDGFDKGVFGITTSKQWFYGQDLDVHILSLKESGDLDILRSAEALKRMAATTQPLPMTATNFAFFGITSCGKSTMLNQFLGKPVAATGAGETTTQIQRYDGSGFSLYDIPGKNDEISYFTMEYVAFWKGLTARLILIMATIKEMTSVFRLLDAINLTYDIVVNKFDQHEEDERDQLKVQIREEINQFGLKGVENIWFVSSKHPQMFDDWLQMVHSLTGRPHKFNNMTRMNTIENNSRTSFFSESQTSTTVSTLAQDQNESEAI